MEDRTGFEKVDSIERMISIVQNAASELRIMLRRSNRELLELDVRTAAALFDNQEIKELLSKIDIDVFTCSEGKERKFFEDSTVSSVLDVLEMGTENVPKSIYRQANDILETLEKRTNASMAISIESDSANNLCESLFRCAEFTELKNEIIDLAYVFMDMSDKLFKAVENRRNASKRLHRLIVGDEKLYDELISLSCGDKHDEFVRLKYVFNSILQPSKSECRREILKNPDKYIGELKNIGLYDSGMEQINDSGKMPDREDFNTIKSGYWKAIEQLGKIVSCSKNNADSAIRNETEAFLDSQAREKISNLDIGVLSYMKSEPSIAQLRNSGLRTIADVIDLDKKDLEKQVGRLYVDKAFKSISEIKIRARELVTVGSLNTCTTEHAISLIKAINYRDSITGIASKKYYLEGLLSEARESVSQVSLPAHDLTWEFLPENKQLCILEAYRTLKALETKGILKESEELKSRYDKLIDPTQSDLLENFSKNKEHYFSVLNQMGYSENSVATVDHIGMPNYKKYIAAIESLERFHKNASVIIDAAAEQKRQFLAEAAEVKAEWVTIKAKNTKIAIIKQYASGARTERLEGTYNSLLEVYNSNTYKLQNIPGIGPVNATKIMMGARSAYSSIERDYKLRVNTIQNSTKGKKFLESLYNIYNSTLIRNKLKEKVDEINPVLAKTEKTDVPSNEVYWYMMTHSKQDEAIAFCTEIIEKATEISSCEKLIRDYYAVRTTGQAKAIRTIADNTAVYDGYIVALFG